MKPILFPLASFVRMDSAAPDGTVSGGGGMTGQTVADTTLAGAALGLQVS